MVLRFFNEQGYNWELSFIHLGSCDYLYRIFWCLRWTTIFLPNKNLQKKQQRYNNARYDNCACDIDFKIQKIKERQRE
jgi:hypothetical protein